MILRWAWDCREDHFFATQKCHIEKIEGLLFQLTLWVNLFNSIYTYSICLHKRTPLMNSNILKNLLTNGHAKQSFLLTPRGLMLDFASLGRSMSLVLFLSSFMSAAPPHMFPIFGTFNQSCVLTRTINLTDYKEPYFRCGSSHLDRFLKALDCSSSPILFSREPEPQKMIT